MTDISLNVPIHQEIAIWRDSLKIQPIDRVPAKAELRARKQCRELRDKLYFDIVNNVITPDIRNRLLTL